METIKLIKANEHNFKPGFASWYELNGAIYAEFEKQALRVASMGRKHYSARTIAEYIRHSTLQREENSQYKLNDHVTPDLARLFALRNPSHAGLFEFRGNSTRSAPKHAHDHANMHSGVAA